MQKRPGNELTCLLFFLPIVVLPVSILVSCFKLNPVDVSIYPLLSSFSFLLSSFLSREFLNRLIWSVIPSIVPLLLPICDLSYACIHLFICPQVCSVIWSKEHHELITGHGYCDNQLIIWKYPTLTKVAELTGHTSRILGMSMSPDGETVVSLGADETLRFWECFKADKSKLKNETKSFGKDLPITSMRMIR